MASARVVRIILQGESGSVVRAFTLAGAAAETAQGKFERMQAVGRGMTSLGATMTRIAAPVVALGAVAVKASATYQQAMTRISTQTSMTARSASTIAGHFTKLSGQLGFSSTQLAEGLYPIASEGLKGTKALQALTAAAKGARIGGDSLTSTASALSSALGSNFKDIHSASEAMVVMERAAGLGKMKLEDLTNAMSTGVTSEATGMGIGMRDLAAALGAMTKQGVPAEQEASRLKLSLTKMAAPTGVALKQVKALGLGQFQLAKDLRKPEGLIVALRDLQAHLGGLNKNQQNAALSNMFGQSRGLSNIRGLLNALPQMTQIRGGLQAATANQFSKRWFEQAKTPAQKFADTMAAVKTAVTNLGTALMPLVMQVLPPLTRDITGLVRFMSHLPKPVRDAVVGFTAFLAIGGPILWTVGNLIRSIDTVSKAMKEMKLATLLTSTAMKASLIGLAVFALIELVTHFKQVKQFAATVWRGIVIGATAVGRALGHVFSTIYNVITWPFRKAFDFIRSGLRSISHLPGTIMHGASSLLHTATFGLLHTGGVVKPKYMAEGGPVGTDTIPGWLTPGEFVLNRAATARIGIPALDRLNNGMGGGMGAQEINISITPLPVNIDGRRVGQAVLKYTLDRAARGPSSLVGGGLMAGTSTA